LRALVTGAHGQLGQALVRLLGDRVAWAGGRDELDVRDPSAVRRVVAAARPDVVINATAYNKVDAAESEPAEALAVNAEGPLHLARAAGEAGARIVHVSTDYVFDGRGTRPYAETDPPNPIGAYGVSKLSGELLVAGATPAHLIVRTSGVFAAGGSRAKGGSFVERILARARAGEPLRVVADQVFSPTYAPDLAQAILALLDRGALGVVHVTNQGTCSWHEMASAALELAGLRGVPVQAIRAEQLAAAARRPAWSVLDNARWRALGLPPLRPWREALREMLASSAPRG
jgi:dTDP-4-dehydrorhamnose reductase